VKPVPILSLLLPPLLLPPLLLPPLLQDRLLPQSQMLLRYFVSF
jgi:hypothetical protein